MNNVVVINPAAIAAGDAQNIIADVSKFDFAKSQVTLVVEKLLPLYKITSDEQVSQALEVMKTAKQVENAIEAKRKSLVQPFNDGATKINDYKKDLVNDLAIGIEKVKTALLDYQKEKEKKAKEELVIARQGQLTQLGFLYNSQILCYSRENVGTITMNQMESYSPDQWIVLITTFTQSIQRLSQKQVQEFQEEKEIIDLFGSDDQKKETGEKLQQAMSETTIAVTPHIPAFGPKKIKGTTKRWAFEVTNSDSIPREYLALDETAIRNAIKVGVREIPGIRIYQEESLSIR